MDRLDCDRMFIAVYEQGNFARAAALLDTSNSRASKLVSELERKLGVQLLKRSTRSLSPTDAGNAYYLRIKEIIESIDNLDSNLHKNSSAPFGNLRISAPSSFGSLQLGTVLSHFMQEYPKISMDCTFTDRLVNIVEEGYDLALRIGTLSDSSLIARKLCDIHIVTIASPDYLKQHGTPQHWQDIAQHELILDTNFKNPTRWQMQENGETVAQSVQARIKFSHPTPCVIAAQAGLGITRVPVFIAKPAIEAGKVVPILQDYELPARALYAMYPSSRHLARKIRVFIDYLVNQFAEGNVRAQL